MSKKLDFIFCKSDDECTDDEYVYSKNKNITIQVCYYEYPDIYSVNKWNEQTCQMMMIPCQSLKQAKEKAINLNN